MSHGASHEVNPTGPVSGVAAGDIPPLPENATPEQKDQHWFKYVYQGDRMPQLTLRAVLMGGVLGMLMAASNLYTTLAIGWAFGVAITACVMSFVIWNVFRAVSGTWLVIAFCGLAFIANIAVTTLMIMSGRMTAQVAAPIGAGLALVIIGAYFFLRRRLSPMSILENNCMQSTASAAGYSTGSTMATMFGALLLLAVTPEGKTAADVRTIDISPIWAVAIFTLCTGLMGTLLAIPLKRQMINHEQLRFPSGVAAAETLRSLYGKGREALEKAYTLVGGIIVGAVVGIINTPKETLAFLDKILPFRLPELIPEHGLTQYAIIGDKLYGKQLPAYGFEPSVLLIAAGVITRMRVCLSMFIGAAILHFWVIPFLVSKDVTMAGSGWITDAAGVITFDRTQAVENVVKNVELNSAGTVLRSNTWALWGGTAVMVLASLTSVAMQWRTIVRAFSSLALGKDAAAERHPDAEAMKSIEVPFKWMILGVTPVAIALLFVQIVAFHIAWWAGLIAIAMSFVLSLVACRATGETDTTPIGAMGKVMQLMFAAFHPGQMVPNLASAGIAANSASSSADLLTDLKSGYLLGANPRKQFIAQFCGVFFGTLVIVPIWFLMVPNKERLDKFAAPATRTWEAVARVLTKGIDFLPVSARWAILFGALVGVALPLIERATAPKYRKYLPSAMGLGLSWVVYFSNAVGFLTGAIIIWIWEMMNRKHADKYAVPLASGLIAGESLIKALIAMTATALGLLGVSN
ncbi:MAG: OPT/YSL family transporter [Phycisphaerales bacterium]|nr:OPT/YSL family transporter [Phycisphaerales bacterium]